MKQITNLTRASTITTLIVLVLTGLSNSEFASNQRASQTVESKLFEKLTNAGTEQVGRSAEDALWQYWFSQSPTDEVRWQLDAGMERREAYDFEAAELHLDKVVALAPDYAEGYNQRAFIRFLRDNLSEAQSDLEIALTLEPKHFGALSGLYHIFSKQGDHQAALKFLQQAVKIHPWLKERSALPIEMWPKSYRDLRTSDQSI